MTASAVHTRRVYYLSGFDPRGALFYHRLYRQEAAKQAALLGVRVDVGARQRCGALISTWRINADWQGQLVSTEYHFLHWSDVIRRYWEHNLLKLLMTSLRGYVAYIGSGAFARVRRGSRGPFFTALYPFAYLLALALTAAALAGGVAWGAWRATGNAVLTGLCAAIAAGAVAWAGIKLAHRLAVFWVLRTQVFLGDWNQEKQALLDARVDALVRRMLDEQRQSPCDEVLVIGHSVGTVLAVLAGARLAEAAQEVRGNLSIVTLGQCLPLLGLAPQAAKFRASLQGLASARDIPWLDMNARADALAFSQVNPLDAVGLAGAAMGRPTRQVVRPFKMFSAPEYARLRRNKLRLHFQYLMASAIPNEYDYFRMTAGPFHLQPV
jgi:hypothetical protein